MTFVVLLQLVFASGASAGTVHHHRSRHEPRNCAPREAAVLLSNPHVEVYQYRFGVYTCLRRSRAIGYLGHTEPTPTWDYVAGEERCGAVSLEALAGTVVAYVESRYEPSGRQPDRIAVRDIPTGKILHTGVLQVATSKLTMVEEARALQVVVKDDGAVAWVQEDFYIRHGGASPPPAVYDVFAVDSDGFRSLRTELPSKPESFTLRGGVLSWKQDGAAHPLVPGPCGLCAECRAGDALADRAGHPRSAEGRRLG